MIYMVVWALCIITTVCYSYRFACQQSVVKMFPDLGYLHSKDVIVYLWHLYIFVHFIYTWLAHNSQNHNSSGVVWNKKERGKNSKIGIKRCWVFEIALKDGGMKILNIQYFHQGNRFPSFGFYSRVKITGKNFGLS